MWVVGESKLFVGDKGEEKPSWGGEGKLSRVRVGEARGTAVGKGKSSKLLPYWLLTRGGSYTTRNSLSSVESGQFLGEIVKSKNQQESVMWPQHTCMDEHQYHVNLDR